MLPETRAVEALISIIIGDSIIMANDPAIPKAARLYFASFNLAIKAMRKGCSKAIISQVSASGPQKRKILRYVSLSVISTIYKSPKIAIYWSGKADCIDHIQPNYFAAKGSFDLQGILSFLLTILVLLFSTSSLSMHYKPILDVRTSISFIELHLTTNRMKVQISIVHFLVGNYTYWIV